MATSCPGKVVTGRKINRLLSNWKLQTLRSTLTLTYHMGHTLQEMGFTLRTLDIAPENILTAQRHQQEVANQRQEVSGDTSVETEPMEIPERQKSAVPEVINLTKEKENERSTQETAMGVSMKSGGSDRSESGDDDSDKLYIDEDDGVASKSKPNEPIETERDPDSVKEQERTTENQEGEARDEERQRGDDDNKLEMMEHDKHETDKDKESEKDKSCEEESVKSDDKMELLQDKNSDLEQNKENDKTESAMDVVEEVEGENAEKDKSIPEDKSVLRDKTEISSPDENFDSVAVNESEKFDISETVVNEDSENKDTEKEVPEIESADQEAEINDDTNEVTSEIEKAESEDHGSCELVENDEVDDITVDTGKTENTNRSLETQRTNQRQDRDSEPDPETCTDTSNKEIEPASKTVEK